MTIQDVFEGVGAAAAGRITDAELYDLECAACPGGGACGGQFTANTMATAFEAMGISPLGSGGVPAMVPEKAEVARATSRRDDSTWMSRRPRSPTGCATGPPRPRAFTPA